MKLKPYTKKVVAISLSLIFSLLIVFLACNKADTKEIGHLPTKITIANVENSHPDLIPILGKRLDGSATLYHFSSGEILITIKSKTDLEIINKFILQATKNEKVFTGIKKINNAEIIYLFDLVLLNDLDENKLTAYSVNSPRYNDTYNKIPQAIRTNITSTINGFGLGYNSGVWKFLNENISLEKSIHTLIHGLQNGTEDEDLGVSCESGGTGATSCSISGCFNSGCSVSCGAGYYACCYCDTILPDLGPICQCKPNT